MCTVALVKHDGGYILGGNRDEQKKRKAGLPPRVNESRGTRYLAPVDATAGGTWIAVNEAGLSLAILNRYTGNAAQPNLSANPPSRGGIIPSLIHHTDLQAVQRQVNERFDATEFRPFALVAIGTDGKAIRWDWNGAELTANQPVMPPALWVSSGYDEQYVSKVRGKVFDDHLQSEQTHDAGWMKALLSSEKPEPGPLAISMEFMHVQTVSSTIVRFSRDGIVMLYNDGLPSRNPNWKSHTLA